MVCLVCEKAKNRNAFASGGSSNFRKSALCSHHVSAAHRLAVKEVNTPNQVVSAPSSVPDTDKATQLARLSYFLAKQGIPIKK